MLCRSMKELRELICQSRLDYHKSDSSDMDSDDLGDTTALGDTCQKLKSCHLQLGNLCCTTTPDSGLASLPRCGSTSDSDMTEDVPANSAMSPHASSQSTVLVSSSLVSETFRCTTADFAMIFDSISHKQVARWLEDANAVISQLSHWCQHDDNFVTFGHFWLSEFPGVERNSLIRMEYDIFVDRLASAFLPTSMIRLCHVTALAEAVLHEFPRRLLSIEGPRLILHWLDVLTSPKRCEQFRKTFSSIHCSTTSHQHSEIVLSLRAFALVSLVSAFVDFYQKLIDNCVHQRPAENISSAREDNGGPSAQLSVSEQRICTSIRKGFVDMVHFLIKSGSVSANFVDAEQRSLVFLAVLHKRSNVLNLLLTHVICRDKVDVNRAADNGNTALHVAAGFGDENLMESLVTAPGINVNVQNNNADGATPLHVAIMHGHKAVVSRLLKAGADASLTVNGQTAAEMAQALEQTDILNLLSAAFSLGQS